MRRKPGEELAVRPNKSQLKRDYDDLQVLGGQLTNATQAVLKKCELPEKLLSAITEYRALPPKHGALRRQLQFIGKLMRDVDAETLARIHQQLNLNVELEKRRFQQLEQLRDRLLAGDNDDLAKVLQHHAQLDPKLLGQLVRQARKEQEQGDSPVAARKLFRYLREKLGEQGTSVVRNTDVGH